MKRREFLGALASAAATWPLAARAQPQALPLIGWLSNATPESYAPFVAAFRRGLGQVDFFEGQNVRIDYRWSRNRSDLLPIMAKELAAVANVIVATGGDQAEHAARAATSTVPIIATIGKDPVELVRNLNRPDGNLTGISVFAGELVPKRLELARELAPQGSSIAFLANEENPNSVLDKKEISHAATTLGQEIIVLGVRTENDCDTAFANLVAQKAGALIVQSDPFFNGIITRLVVLAARHTIPVVFPRREFADNGGLLSYGTSLKEAYRQVGIYAGRVLKGATPAELPIQMPIKFEFVVNLKTARALGISLPTSILLRADEVIE